MTARRGASMLLAVLVVCAASPADAQRVRQVFDGDTISVANVGVVRLIGVDAPEKHGSYREAEPFGDAAAAYLRALLLGKDVRLEYDGPRLDPYKRTLAYVFLADGRLANLEVIRAGWAETYRRFEFRRKPDFLAAERDAHTAQRGMWKARRRR
jgi:micrococcal nuclease